MRTIILSLILFLFVEGCTVTPYVTYTKKSSVEQLLVSKALDHALQGVFFQTEGVRVYIDVASLTWDEDDYIRKAVLHWFLKKGALLTSYEKEADYVASVLVKCAGTGGKQMSIGLPAVPVPLVPGITTPQLNVFSALNQDGYAELEIILYDVKAGSKETTPPMIGKSYHHDYSILFISFTRKDIY